MSKDKKKETEVSTGTAAAAAPALAQLPSITKEASELYWKLIREQLPLSSTGKYPTLGHVLVEKISANANDKDKKIEELRIYIQNLQRLLEGGITAKNVYELFFHHTASAESLGYIIAIFTTDDIVIQFLNLLCQFVEKYSFDVDKIFDVLDQKYSSKNNIIFSILMYRDETVMVNYLQLLAVLKNKGLSSDKIDAHLLNGNFLNLIVNFKIGKILHAFISNGFAINPKILGKFQIDLKGIIEALINYIKTITNNADAIQILTNALNSKHPLGLFFALDKSCAPTLILLLKAREKTIMHATTAALQSQPQVHTDAKTATVDSTHPQAVTKNKWAQAARFVAPALGISTSSADLLLLSAAAGAANSKKTALTEAQMRMTFVGNMSLSGGKSLNADHDTVNTVVCSQRDDDAAEPPSP